MAFNIPAGVAVITVEEVLVEEGESVEEGQLLAKLDTSEWDDVLTALERDLLQAEINLKNAKLALERAEEETSITITGDIRENYTDPEEIDIKELQVELAEARFEDARKALAEALEKSPEIIAPFDGFITKVNVDGGDEVKTGTVAVSVADPNKFEADILVSEMDILQVKLGGEARVQVDAMQGMSLPAKVTHISPTATIQQGVVNYEVKVEVQSLEAVTQERQQARQEAVQRIQQGELPERLRQAVEAGRLTQEQAEEIIKQRQQGQGRLPGGRTGGQTGQVPAILPQDFQLREGLTVTVSIIVDERKDVLLVPNRAITRHGGETIVQVLKDGVVEERSIKTGISNYQNTEVIEGLSEGEQVVIPQATTTNAPTTPQPRGPMPFLRPPRR
jgi:HlyD family secretion protein